MNDETFDILGATAEAMGAQLSAPALNLMADDLSEFSDEKIRYALKRLRQDSARFTVRDIVNRMPGMWPGSEVAWSQAPRDENLTVITTREALAAWDVAQGLDSVSGRMAFKEMYERSVSESKAEGRSPEWIVSLGLEPHSREQVILDGVKSGLLPPSKARVHLPHIPIHDIEQLTTGGTSTHELLEKHQATVKSIAHLSAPNDDAVSAAEAKKHLDKIMSILKVQRREPEPANVTKSPRRAQAEADLATMNRVMPERI